MIDHISQDMMKRLMKYWILLSLLISIECVKESWPKLIWRDQIAVQVFLKLFIVTLVELQMQLGMFKLFYFFYWLFPSICLHFLIVEKPNVLEVFKIYETGVENQLEKKIKLVRSDHGGKYDGRYEVSIYRIVEFLLRRWMVSQSKIVCWRKKYNPHLYGQKHMSTCHS